MTIQYKHYLIKPNGFGSYDLIRKVTRNKNKSKEDRTPTGETYQSEEFLFYGLQVDSAIRKIIYHELADRNEIVDLQKFIKEYKELQERVIGLVPNV